MRFYVYIFCSKNMYDFSNWKWEWRFFIRSEGPGVPTGWWSGRSLHSYFLFLGAQLCDSATLACGSCKLLSSSFSQIPLFCDPVNRSPPGSSVCGFSQARITGAGCHAFLQGIFPTQGSNPHLLHRQASSWPLSHQGPARPCSSANSFRRLLPVIKFRMLVWWAFLDNLL